MRLEIRLDVLTDAPIMFACMRQLVHSAFEETAETSADMLRLTLLLGNHRRKLQTFWAFMLHCGDIIVDSKTPSNFRDLCHGWIQPFHTRDLTIANV